MNRARAEAVLEAVLFTMGESVEISRLADVIEEDVRTTKEILKGMEERYGREDRGITLTRFENAVQLCTKSDMYEYLVRIAKTPKKLSLTDTVLETLSIIAYKQPVTRVEVERVRGVNCDHAINKLLEYDLITELGRLDAPGRPLLFGTTEQFLRCFGVGRHGFLLFTSAAQRQSADGKNEIETVLFHVGKFKNPFIYCCVFFRIYYTKKKIIFQDFGSTGGCHVPENSESF